MADAFYAKREEQRRQAAQQAEMTGVLQSIPNIDIAGMDKTMNSAIANAQREVNLLQEQYNKTWIVLKKFVGGLRSKCLNHPNDQYKEERLNQVYTRTRAVVRGTMNATDYIQQLDRIMYGTMLSNMATGGYQQLWKIVSTVQRQYRELQEKQAYFTGLQLAAAGSTPGAPAVASVAATSAAPAALAAPVLPTAGPPVAMATTAATAAAMPAAALPTAGIKRKAAGATGAAAGAAAGKRARTDTASPVTAAQLQSTAQLPQSAPPPPLPPKKQQQQQQPAVVYPQLPANVQQHRDHMLVTPEAVHTLLHDKVAAVLGPRQSTRTKATRATTRRASHAAAAAGTASAAFELSAEQIQEGVHETVSAGVEMWLRELLTVVSRAHAHRMDTRWVQGSDEVSFPREQLDALHTWGSRVVERDKEERIERLRRLAKQGGDEGARRALEQLNREEEVKEDGNTTRDALAMFAPSRKRAKRKIATRYDLPPSVPRPPTWGTGSSVILYIKREPGTEGAGDTLATATRQQAPKKRTRISVRDVVYFLENHAKFSKSWRLYRVYAGK